MRTVRSVTDAEVVRAFVAEGARGAFGPTLHVEGDALMLNGWWHLAFRVAPDAFILRNEEPPEPTTALEEVASALEAQGLRQVGVDLPLIQPVTYVALSLGHVSWAMWCTDLESAQAALTAAAGAETFLGESRFEESAPDFGAQLAGARRLAGLPPSLVLTVGLAPPDVEALQAALPDCRMESRAWADADPDACGALIPSAVVVDASAQQGREFVMQLRASACGRFLPVAAVLEGAGVPLGADIALDPAQGPAGWVEPLRQLLP